MLGQLQTPSSSVYSEPRYLITWYVSMVIITLILTLVLDLSILADIQAANF